jgi:hypothetical protein
MSDELEAQPASAVLSTTIHITRIFDYSPKDQSAPLAILERAQALLPANSGRWLEIAKSLAHKDKTNAICWS